MRKSSFFCGSLLWRDCFNVTKFASTNSWKNIQILSLCFGRILADRVIYRSCTWATRRSLCMYTLHHHYLPISDWHWSSSWSRKPLLSESTSSVTERTKTPSSDLFSSSQESIVSADTTRPLVCYRQHGNTKAPLPALWLHRGEPHQVNLAPFEIFESISLSPMQGEKDRVGVGKTVHAQLRVLRKRKQSSSYTTRQTAHIVNWRAVCPYYQFH